MTKFKKYRKISGNESNSVQTSKLTDRDREESIRLLPPKWLLSWINIWIVHFRPKLFAVSSIKLESMEKPPSGYFWFPLSTFRRGWTGLEITRAGLQTNRSKWYFPTRTVLIFCQLQGEFMCGGNLGKLKPLTAFPQWSAEVSWWWRHLPGRQCSDTYRSRG